ncbi:MAG: hypothetical protein KAH18_07800 [Psychromonas sp.]|nr:hypothetical protein [Psychromonas sp.]
MISNENEQILKDGIKQLNSFLDSPTYMQMIDNVNTPPATQKILNDCWAQRDKLSRNLLKLYAIDIKDNDSKFQSLIDQMKAVNDQSAVAVQGLTKVSSITKSAVSLAKLLDEAVKIVEFFIV